MGRSTKKGVDYFPHDTDASEKTTLFALEAKYGNDGYAFWFKLLEILGKKETASLDCSDINEWFYLLHRMRMEEQRVREILDLLADLKAIDPPLWRDHQIVWSDNFVQRLNVVYGKRKEGAPKKPLSQLQSEPIPVTEKPVSDAEKPISTAEIQIPVTEKPVSDTEIAGPFNLTEAEIRQSVEANEAIEAAARSNGIPLHESGMLKARELARIYGLDKLLDAIKIAGLGASQTWRYVEGILKKDAAKNPATAPVPTTTTAKDANPYAEYRRTNQ